MENKRVLSLDVGDRKIGVAISDALGITARGLTTIIRSSDKKDTGAIMDMIRDNDCSMVVVGLPLKLDGTDSPQTEKVRDFSNKLQNKLKSNSLANVEIRFHDERFTTKIAEQVLIEADLSREKRKGVIDKQAAVVILQSFLEGNFRNN